MNRLEILANELALLSNQSIVQLAQILVTDYPTRADVLETQLSAAFQDNDMLLDVNQTGGKW
jgi:hypothetical protein